MLKSEAGERRQTTYMPVMSCHYKFLLPVKQKHTINQLDHFPIPHRHPPMASGHCWTVWACRLMSFSGTSGGEQTTAGCTWLHNRKSYVTFYTWAHPFWIHVVMYGASMTISSHGSWEKYTHDTTSHKSKYRPVAIRVVLFTESISVYKTDDWDLHRTAPRICSPVISNSIHTDEKLHLWRVERLYIPDTPITFYDFGEREEGAFTGVKRWNIVHVFACEWSAQCFTSKCETSLFSLPTHLNMHVCNTGLLGMTRNISPEQRRPDHVWHQ